MIELSASRDMPIKSCLKRWENGGAAFKDDCHAESAVNRWIVPDHPAPDLRDKFDGPREDGSRKRIGGDGPREKTWADAASQGPDPSFDFKRPAIPRGKRAVREEDLQEGVT